MNASESRRGRVGLTVQQWILDTNIWLIGLCLQGG